MPDIDMDPPGKLKAHEIIGLDIKPALLCRFTLGTRRYAEFLDNDYQPPGGNWYDAAGNLDNTPLIIARRVKGEYVLVRGEERQRALDYIEGFKTTSMAKLGISSDQIGDEHGNAKMADVATTLAMAAVEGGAHPLDAVVAAIELVGPYLPLATDPGTAEDGGRG